MFELRAVLASFFLSSALSFWGCKSDTQIHQPAKSSFAPIPASRQQIQPESDLVIPEIGRKTWHPGSIKINAPFCADSALKALFPGNFSIKTSEFGSDSFHLVHWICKDCEKMTYSYAFWSNPDEDVSDFPNPVLNTTVLLGTETLSIGGKQYKALIFYHTELEVPEFCGRFSGSPTGIALFSKEKNAYILKNFSVICGNYGSFSRPIYPVFYGDGTDQMLVDFTVYNGGSGGDYTEVKELFIPYKNTFRRVMREEFLSCVNSPRGEWRTNLVLVDSTADVLLTTTGQFHGRYFYGADDYDWLFDKAPVVFKTFAKAAIKDSLSYSFTLTRTYVRNKQSYHLRQSDLNYKRIETPGDSFQPAWVLE